jgi:hypothetical protein
LGRPVKLRVSESSVSHPKEATCEEEPEKDTTMPVTCEMTVMPPAEPSAYASHMTATFRRTCAGGFAVAHSDEKVANRDIS